MMRLEPVEGGMVTALYDMYVAASIVISTW